MVRVERGDHGAWLAVQVFADVQVRCIVATLSTRTFVTGPAEVLDGCVVHNAVDLFPIVPSDVAHVELPSSGTDSEPEGVTHPVRNDPPHVQVRIRELRVVRQSLASIWIDTNDRAVEASWIS